MPVSNLKKQLLYDNQLYNKEKNKQSQKSNTKPLKEEVIRDKENRKRNNKEPRFLIKEDYDEIKSKVDCYPLIAPL